MLTGPTGCGKTRLVEHLGARVGRPVVTISCHDDLTSSDLVGRFLVSGGDVAWQDGPLTRAVRQGAICYLDEVVEARHDSLAILHSLTDHRRTLFLDRQGEAVVAPDTFMLVCSYNPAYRSTLKELKPSFRQRFVTVGAGLPAGRTRGRGDRRRDRHHGRRRRPPRALRRVDPRAPTPPSTSSRRRPARSSPPRTSSSPG